jgi:hypothetical protein
MDRRTLLVLFSILVALLIGAAPASAVTTPSVVNGSPSNAAGARTQYVVTFATTAAGATTIDVTFPTGTGFSPGWGGGIVYDDTTSPTRVGTCFSPSSGTLKVSCTVSPASGAGRSVRLVLNGVTNPATANPYTLSVATSVETATVSNPYTVAANHPSGPPSVLNAAPSNAAGARTQYTIWFATSTTGGLGPEANSTIDVTFPTGTGFSPGWGGGVVYDDATQARIGTCFSPNSSTPLVVNCTISAAIGPSKPVRLVLNGITNPGTPLDTYTFGIDTSSDAPTGGPQYNVVANHPSGTPAVVNTTPSNAAGARTQYTISFATSTTGGLAPEANSTIDVTFPSGTGFSAGWGGGIVYDDTTQARIGTCFSPNSSTPLVVNCTISAAIGPSKPVRLVLNGITNPTTVAPNKTLTVDTTSDTPAISSQYGVVARNPLTGLSAVPADTSQSATTSYDVRFATSATGGLGPQANSGIDVLFPGGTTFGHWGGGIVYDDTTQARIGTCFSPNTSTPLVVNCTISAAIGPSRPVRLALNGVSNPPTAGSYHVTVSTSSDTATVQSGDYGIAVDNTPPETALVAGPPDTTTDPMPTFTFSASEAGSTFQCSLDGAPFTTCTSPYRPPAPLAPGVHTFAVKATDPASNTDPTPVTRTFTIAVVSQATPTPAPSPTPTPAPAPRPVAGQSVVIAPVSGKILVRRPGSNQFVELDATQGVPLGSTLDTKGGVLELTSVQTGGQPQKARIYAGIFKISQTKTTTDLTLNEPLAPCGKARAAAKKPKTRKLWGDGSGAFRTRGQYSAATVRGTKWLVQDSCAGTLTKVAKGVVSVRDNVKRKTILVKAGKSYLAKPRR